jgi:hypothetical protein
MLSESTGRKAIVTHLYNAGTIRRVKGTVGRTSRAGAVPSGANPLLEEAL